MRTERTSNSLFSGVYAYSWSLDSKHMFHPHSVTLQPNLPYLTALFRLKREYDLMNFTFNRDELLWILGY